MSRETQKVLAFVLKIISDRRSFIFWLFIRVVSAILPLATIYLFSLIIKQLETGVDFLTIFYTLAFTFFIRLADNYLRLKSVTKLENIISNISFDVHNFFLRDLQGQSKEDRHAAVQAIRNFSDASSVTLNLIKQPGVDSIVSFLIIPVILFTLDFPSFILTIAYISIYYCIDTYTTQHYSQLKDIQNSKTEAYYAKLQDSNDFDLEQISFSRHFNRLTRWGFKEWFALQNSAVLFYCLIFLYLIYLVSTGQKDLSQLILIMGYVTQTQVFLNSISSIKDSFTDMHVGLKHLAKNEAISSVDLEDLI